MLFLEFAGIFILGSVGYGFLEMLWRGHTHWTMLLTGGLCFYAIYVISTRMRDCLWKKCLMCASIVTTIEFVVGCIVNIRLGWSVWDYSNMPYNLMGQICPSFSAAWLLLSIPCMLFSKLLNTHVFARRR